jgi:hypothetical protein
MPGHRRIETGGATAFHREAGDAVESALLLPMRAAKQIPTG